MGAVVIVLGDPAADAFAGFLERAVLVQPDFFLLERAVEALDQPVAFGMVRR